MDSKPLIAISFIDKNVKPHCSNDYLVNLPQQDIRIFIRPSNFEELQNLKESFSDINGNKRIDIRSTNK